MRGRKRSSRQLCTCVVVAAFLIGGSVGKGAELPEPPKSNAPSELWTCGMHPQVLKADSGLCSICGMELTPKKADTTTGTSGGSTVVIDPAMVQNIGVRTAEVIHGRLRRIVRSVGTLMPPPAAQHDVSSPLPAMVTRLHISAVGVPVHRGDPLVELRVQAPLIPGHSAPLPAVLTLTSPCDGYVSSLAVNEGSSVGAGHNVVRVADTTAMAIEAHTSQSNLPFLREGQQVEVRFAARPGEKHKGKLLQVAPDLEAAGLALLRVAMEPPAPTLLPGMQASIAVFAMTEEETLLAPRDAVIDSGTRRLAFVQRGAGRFEPRELRIAASADDWVQVVEGLDKGERVVTSGQFLLDSESRMQQAIEKYRSGWVPPALKSESSH